MNLIQTHHNGVVRLGPIEILSIHVLLTGP